MGCPTMLLNMVATHRRRRESGDAEAPPLPIPKANGVHHLPSGGSEEEAPNIVPARLLKVAALLFLGLVVALIVGLVLSLDKVNDDERDKEERKCRRHFDIVRAYGLRVQWQAKALGRELEMSSTAPFPDEATNAR
jgi:hypothetical protein